MTDDFEECFRIVRKSISYLRRKIHTYGKDLLDLIKKILIEVTFN